MNYLLFSQTALQLQLWSCKHFHTFHSVKDENCPHNPESSKPSEATMSRELLIWCQSALHSAGLAPWTVRLCWVKDSRTDFTFFFSYSLFSQVPAFRQKLKYQSNHESKAISSSPSMSHVSPLLIFKFHLVLVQPNQVTFCSTTAENISDTHERLHIWNCTARCLACLQGPTCFCRGNISDDRSCIRGLLLNLRFRSTVGPSAATVNKPLAGA